jgi:hypothetical protein
MRFAADGGFVLLLLSLPRWAGLGWLGSSGLGWLGWSGLFGLGWAGRLSLIIENRLGRGRLRRCQPFDETFGCDLVDFKGERLRRDRGLGFI